MAIVGRTATVAENASATSVTGTLPTDRQAGDLCVVVFATPGTPAQFTGPGGSWVQLAAPTNNGASETVAAYYQFTPGSAPTASTSAAASRITAITQSYANVDATTPIDVAASITTASGATSINAPTVTTVTAGALLLSVAMADTSPATRTWVTPSGMTLVGQATVSGRSLGLAQELRSTAGATGTRNWTHSPVSGGISMAAFQTALRPAGFTGTVASTFAITGANLLTGMTGARAETFAAAGATLGLGATMTGTRASTFSAASAALSVTSRVFTAALEIEFTAGVWTDVTSRLAFRVAPLTIRQGRATEYDDVTPGVLTCALFNDDGALMPDNTGSPYYPNVVAGKRIRWKVTKSSTTYTRFVGWIQALAPDFPGESTYGSVVAVTATDALGLLAQRILRSNHTEHLLALAHAAGDVAVEAYEAVGKTSGFIARMTNYSNDSGKQTSNCLYSTTDATLSFASDDDVSIGDIVTAPSAASPSKVFCNFRSGMLMIVFHIKTFSSTPAAEQGFVTMYTASTNYHLTCLTSGNIVLRNAGLTTTLGTIGTMPTGQWCRIRGKQNAGTPTQSDWQLSTQDGAFLSVTGVAIDVRALVAIYFPAMFSTGTYPGSGFGGVGAIANNGTIGTPNSFPGSAQGTTADRITDVADALAAMPVAISTVGTLTSTNVVTGEWSRRTALDVLQEVVRTDRAIAWARSRDSTIYAAGFDQLYPTAVVATVDTDADCAGPPRLVHGTESRPTRVDASWPAGVSTAVDTAAEASGLIRSKSISTVAADAATATAAATEVLTRPAGRNLRISRVMVDLITGATDHTAALFSESTILGGLYPTQRIRTIVPVSHFGSPTLDHHVLGWQETYTPEAVTVTLDTIPATAVTLASETWTGTNGAGWPAQWSAASGGGVSGSTVDIQSNRGRLLSGAGGDVWKRLTGFTATDVEITGLVQVQGTAEAQVLWRADSTLANGYALIFSVSGGVRVQQIVSGVISNLFPTFGPSISASTDYRFRLRSQGQYLSIRTWAAAGSEPGTWDLNTTNTLFLSAGFVALRQWTASQTALFDDLAVTTGG